MCRRRPRNERLPRRPRPSGVCRCVDRTDEAVFICGSRSHHVQCRKHRQALRGGARGPRWAYHGGLHPCDKADVEILLWPNLLQFLGDSRTEHSLCARSPRRPPPKWPRRLPTSSRLSAASMSDGLSAGSDCCQPRSILSRQLVSWPRSTSRMNGQYPKREATQAMVDEAARTITMGWLVVDADACPARTYLQRRLGPRRSQGPTDRQSSRDSRPDRAARRSPAQRTGDAACLAPPHVASICRRRPARSASSLRPVAVSATGHFFQVAELQPHGGGGG